MQWMNAMGNAKIYVMVNKVVTDKCNEEWSMQYFTEMAQHMQCGMQWKML